MTTRAREKRGIPTGGQFAATSHDEAPVALAAEGLNRAADSQRSHGAAANETGEAMAKAAKALKPKKRTTTVTIDGHVFQRTSESRQYTHAVVMSEELPEKVISVAELTIRNCEQENKEIDAWLDDPKRTVRIRNRGFSPASPDGDPDKNYRGEPAFHSHEAYIPRASGSSKLASTWCNSKGIAGGVYDFETGKLDSAATQHVRDAFKAKLRDTKARNIETIAQSTATIEAVKDGTYELKPPYVTRWSSKESLAQRAAASEFSWEHSTRRAIVVPVDAPEEK